jgi:GNAT superfamily N-acetyltransferase
MRELIDKVRSFNRTVTQTIGALDDHYLGRSRALAECRVLFEVGASGAEVGEVRARLDLDSGYTSRLLRSLERQGLVQTAAGSADRRVRAATLTVAGMEELSELNRRSDQLARSILGPLNDRQKNRLVEAMAVVERLMTAVAVHVEEVPPHSRDAQYCLHQYFQELGQRFEEGFDPTQSLAPTIDEFAAPHGTFIVMRLRGEPVGCGGFKPEDGGTAYIKRMWVSPNARGLGLGRRLLSDLEERARSLGYRKIRLETQKALTEAQQLYRSSGYREVPRFNDELYAHHWFEKPLV